MRHLSGSVLGSHMVHTSSPRPGRTRTRLALAPVALALAVTVLASGCRLTPGPGAGRSPIATSSPAVSVVIETLRPDSPTPTTEPERQVTELTYIDIAGAERRVLVDVRLPDRAATDPVPVVVWTHGGSTGKSDPTRLAHRWGAAFNSSGYAFVAIAHTGRTIEQRRPVCEAIGAEACEQFNTMFWDRPHDIGVVFDWLETEADQLGIDPTRLVYGGHSAGAIGVMTTAGMAWPFASELAPPSDPRPVAFLAASPPGAAARGITAEHLTAIDRPMLFLSGLGDTTSSTESADRRATFEMLAPDQTGRMLWVDDATARHTVFNLEPAACRRAGGTAAGCRSLVRTIGHVGVGFVQAAVSSDDPDLDSLDRFVGRQLGARFEWLATAP